MELARQKAARAINTLLVQTYWEIGRYIVEYEQGGSAKAAYGSQLLQQLSKDLIQQYGKGFSRSNLFYMRKIYLAFPKSETLSHKLSWSHYFEILKAEDSLEIDFYIRQCEKDNWSVRELKRQMKSLLYHRLALGKDKEEIQALSQKGQDIQKAEDIIKDPYVLEFLDISNSKNYLEGELEDQIITHLQSFLLELGKGFSFIGRQYRISIGGRHFYVDLVFYHYILKCFVLIDLKRGVIDHEDIGQMNLYLNYFKKEIAPEGDQAPIGIVLGAYKDELLVEYALDSIDNQLFLSKYQLYLPDRATLKAKLKQILEE